VLLSGLSVVGTVQDAISNYYVTAAGRAAEILLLSAGLLTGVAPAAAAGVGVLLGGPAPGALALAGVALVAAGPWVGLRARRRDHPAPPTG